MKRIAPSSTATCADADGRPSQVTVAAALDAPLGKITRNCDGVDFVSTPPVRMPRPMPNVGLSASFEIIRDLVEKLPVMIAPRWLNTLTQPIAIRNVIEFLSGVLLNENTFNQSYDIGGPDILTYKQMLLRFAKIRGLRRRIGTDPVMTPKLSSYWLYFITSTSYRLAQNLVDSMKVEVICKENNLTTMSDFLTLRYGKRAFLGALATVGVLLAITPYIGLQLKSISDTFNVLVHKEITPPLVIPIYQDTAFYVALLLAMFGLKELVRILEGGMVGSTDPQDPGRRGQGPPG